MLLPEELAPELGVKSKGLHFLTAGDQGVWVQAGVGSGGWGRAMDSSPSGAPSPHRPAARVGGRLRAVCVHPAAAAGPRAGADALRPGPFRRHAAQCHCRPQPAALRGSLPAAA